jgi:hypothetical protein
MCCGRVGHRKPRSRLSFASTVLPNPSASFGCPTRRGQIAIEPAAPPDISLPAIAARPLINTASGKALLGSMSVLSLPAQPIDATQALNLSAGVSNSRVLRGRSFS